MWMTFVDYLIVLLLSFFGLMVFSWLLGFSWGYAVYGAVFCLVLFGMIYARGWNAAKKDGKDKTRDAEIVNGIRLIAPLVLFNLIVILLFALVKYNLLPVRDLIVKTVFEFPENQPRIEHQITFYDTLTPYIRVWFSYLVGFMGEATAVSVLLISPVLIAGGGVLGYFAGMKKFYISDVIFKTKEKMKEKFNE
jgi:hypothetical protein